MILWRHNAIFDEDLIESVIQKVSSEKNWGTEKVSSSFWEPDIFKRPELIIQKLMKDLGLFHRASYEFSHWTQVYHLDTEVAHRIHDHWNPQVFLSWVHFIRTTDQDCFRFYDSDGNAFYPPQNKGDFIVFPSWALHSVVGSKDRSVIAGNIMIEDIHSPELDHMDIYYKFNQIGKNYKEGIIYNTSSKYISPIVDWKNFK